LTKAGDGKDQDYGCPQKKSTRFHGHSPEQIDKLSRACISLRPAENAQLINLKTKYTRYKEYTPQKPDFQVKKKLSKIVC